MHVQRLFVHPAAADELREATVFYSMQADQALGLAFISEFERTFGLLSNNPELGAVWRKTTRRLPMRRFHTIWCIRPIRKKLGCCCSASASPPRLLEKPTLNSRNSSNRY